MPIHLFSILCEIMPANAVQAWIEYGGYAALFGLLLACGMGLPLPEDIPLIISGVLISQHHMHWWFAAPAAWLGIIGGDTILYSLGRKFGENITRMPVVGAHIKPPLLHKAALWFDKYGVAVVAVGRLFAGVRGAVTVAAGVTRFSYIKFIVTDSLAAIFSGGLFMLLGFWCGSNYQALRARLTMILLIAGIAVGLGIAIYLRIRARRKPPVIAAVLEKADQIVGPAVVRKDTAGASAGHVEPAKVEPAKTD